MTKIYIVGNPNSGKTTLFNRITKSSEHVGNWHGVTVDKTSKLIKFENDEYELVDLPGIYSLNAFSLEEQVSIDEINLNTNCPILYLLDANNFRRGMLLAIQLLIKYKNIKILINNYDIFKRNGGQIDIEYLHKILGCEVEIINAQQIKVNANFFKFNTNQTSFIKMLGNQLTKKQNESKEELKNKQLENINILYNYIQKIDKNCITKTDKIYGFSKFDKKTLKLSVYFPLFLILIFGVIYFTFFLVGPRLSDWFLKVLYYLIQKPIMGIITHATNSSFVIALFESGIFGACFSVLGFLPQICLMYLFLSILENSGIITRIAFLLDDFLTKVGLNGKIVYTMLMGLGCSTTASISTQNMQNKNEQIKASMLIPYISCSAKLPIYITIASALFTGFGIWVILGLYLLGFVVSTLMAIILDKTILKSKSSSLIIEFPPLKFPNWKNVWMSIKTSCKNFVFKVFGVIAVAGILLWIVSNINIKFQYVEDVRKSILYSFSSIISWAFKPIGLNNPNIICALLIGLVAKELILSSFAIFNKVGNLSLLGSSLIASSSAVCFDMPMGLSFLIFTLLYFPCISTLGVLLKQIGVKYTLISVAIQFAIAYGVSFIIYNLLTRGVVYILITVLVIIMITICIMLLYKKIKLKKIFCNCINCNKCKK